MRIFNLLDEDYSEAQKKYGISDEDMLVAEPALKRLCELYPEAVVSISPAWYLDLWSRTYILRRPDGRRWFLKGTPRSRPEARVMEILCELTPEHVPFCIISDVLPQSQLRWFLLEDAGEVSQGDIDLDTATRAAYVLGCIQRTVEDCQELRNILPRCDADGLQDATLNVCQWILDHSMEEDSKNRLLELTSIISKTTPFFEHLRSSLATQSSTCIHGDFWSGNFGVADGHIRIFDWGDAMWGVGGISIVGMLSQHKKTLSSHSQEIWASYAEGLGRDVDREYVKSCSLASEVAAFIGCMEINRCCGTKPDNFDGFLKTLERLCVLAQDHTTRRRRRWSFRRR